MTTIPDVVSLADPVWTITEDVFSAMIDGEPGHVARTDGPAPALAEPLHAWVDVEGGVRGRVLVSAEAPTARELARCLLGMGEDEEVVDDDVVDALGEVANVVGGNVKSLVPHADVLTLTLPQVAPEPPAATGWRVTHELVLDWRGRAVVLVVALAATA